MTLTRAATAPLPPHLDVQSLEAVRLPEDLRRAIRGRIARPLERMPQLTRPQRLVHAHRITTHIRAPPGGPSRLVHDHPAVSAPHQPRELSLRPRTPASDAGAGGASPHSADVRATLSGGASPSR